MNILITYDTHEKPETLEVGDILTVIHEDYEETYQVTEIGQANGRTLVAATSQ